MFSLVKALLFVSNKRCSFNQCSAFRLTLSQTTDRTNFCRDISVRFFEHVINWWVGIVVSEAFLWGWGKRCIRFHNSVGKALQR